MSPNDFPLSRLGDVTSSMLGALFKEPEFDRWCRVFQNTPIDIVRLILELAAQIDVQTAASIALVSKEVNVWITPTLYRTVVLAKSSHVVAFNKLMEDACAPGASRSKLQHTTTLILLIDGKDMPNPNFMSKSCIALRSLHIHRDNVYGVDVNFDGFQVPKSLCQLVVFGWTNSRPPYAYLPLYTTLTHLSFVHDSPRFFPLDVKSAFPCLTHFACAYRIRGERGDAPYDYAVSVMEDLSSILKKVLLIPCLRIALVLAQDFAMDRPFTEEELQGIIARTPHKNDRRVVLVSRHPSEDDQSLDMLDAGAWDVRSDSSFWAVAEKVIRGRGL